MAKFTLRQGIDRFVASTGAARTDSRGGGREGKGERKKGGRKERKKERKNTFNRS